MELGSDATAILETIAEPALVVDAHQRVAALNRRACALLGPGSAGRPLDDLHASPPEEVRRFLERCRGSADGLLGVLLLRRGEGVEKRRCRGARVRLGGEAGVLLTLDRGAGERFVALSQKVAELNAEIGERRHAEAVLAEALRERDLLLRELHHRVKNNMHMLAALLRGAEREAASPEAKAVLRDAAQRLGAVSAVQQLIYGGLGPESLDGAELVGAVAQAAVALAPRRAELLVEAEPFPIPIDPAASVALIVNELVTNAAKHALPAEGGQMIRVRWMAESGGAGLVVEDNGPGFAPSESSRRASGLGLVRGLLRQLGGSLAFEAGPAEGRRGARCVVRLPLQRAPTASGGLA